GPVGHSEILAEGQPRPALARAPVPRAAPGPSPLGPGLLPATHPDRAGGRRIADAARPGVPAHGQPPGPTRRARRGREALAPGDRRPGGPARPRAGDPRVRPRPGDLVRRLQRAVPGDGEAPAGGGPVSRCDPVVGGTGPEIPADPQISPRPRDRF